MKKLTKKLQVIVKELKNMADSDQGMRNTFYNTGEWHASVDRQNTQRMKEIINEIGWPTISKFGTEASSDAWLLAQHADHDLEFQKKCLELMKSANKNEVSKRDIAYLEDRIATSEKRGQIYGTQFRKSINGEFVPLPIQDPKNVDRRRKRMGLETLSDNIRFMQKLNTRNRS